MKCEMARESMVLALYGDLAGEQGSDLEWHLKECEGCRNEMAAIGSLFETLAARPVVEPSPNLLAESRMRLDEALDEIPVDGFAARLRMSFFRWVWNLRSAPALATLLVGCGFLAGNFTNRYQAAHMSVAPAAAPAPEIPNGSIANVSGVMSTTDPEVVQVLYNRIVPESVEGSLNDPQIRALLLIGSQTAEVPSVRKDAVGMLGHECREGHACPADADGKGVRAALLMALRTDEDAGVRMKALEGLEPYVGEDRKVRDALLVSLLHDPSAEVRREAVGLLKPVQGDSSVRQVLRTVSTTDANPYIRTASFQALQGADLMQ